MSAGAPAALTPELTPELAPDDESTIDPAVVVDLVIRQLSG